MRARLLKAGTRMYFGAPANPMSETIARAICSVVRGVPGIQEAHLPQCYVEGDADGQQVLVAVADNDAHFTAVLDRLLHDLELVLPSEHFIDVLPITSGPVLEAIRQADCQILRR